MPAALLVAGVAACPAAAQIDFDDTFGSPGPAPTDPSGTTFIIDQSRGGTVASGGRTHLFHSFELFDVPAAHTAEFRTADDVDTILSRVTGPLASQIDGDLRVRNTSGVGGPDLFLLNPNGVIFGGATRLDMDGALYVSTADFVGFEDGSLFSASDPGLPLPTTAAAPSVLGFAASGSGDVSLEGRVFSNDAGAQDAAMLTIVGRNVLATGAGLLAPERATLQIAAVGAGALDVPIDLATLDVSEASTTTGSILIGGGTAAQQFNVSTTGPNPDQGRIVIRGGLLTLDYGSLIAGGDGSAPNAGPAVDVVVADTVRIEGEDAKIGSVTRGAFGPGGVRIAADRLEIRDNGSVEITTNGGDANLGRLEVSVRELAIDGAASEIKSTATSSGDGGAISIQASAIDIRSDGRILSETRDPGLGTPTGGSGAIAIAAETIELDSGGRILSITNGPGPSGDVAIRAQSFAARDLSRILSASTDTGSSGRIDIRVNGPLSLQGASAIASGPAAISAPDGPPPLGPAGEIVIEANGIAIDGGSQISATTAGSGAAGDVAIIAHDQLVVRGQRPGANQPSGIFARSGTGFGSAATGDGGSISLRGGRIELSQGAEVGVQTFGSGRAGEIDVRAEELLLLRGARVVAASSDVGATGDIRLSAGDEVRLVDGAEVLAAAPVPRADAGSAGDVEIVAGRLIRIEDSTVATDSARPETGDLRMRSYSAIAIVGSGVTTNVDAASGRGGDISLETDALGLASAQITANAEGSNAGAGNVSIVASDGIVATPNSVVEARAELGVDGEVVLAAPETNITAELGVVAAEYRDPAEALTAPCSARSSHAGSFSLRARRAPDYSPDRALRGDEGGADAGRDAGCEHP